MDLINQALNEQCVYDSIYGQTKAHWFSYIVALGECVSDGENMKAITNDCHENLVQRLSADKNDGLSIDYDKYKTCKNKQLDALQKFKDDKSHSYEKSGSFLDRDYEARFNVGFSFHPSVAVNNITFRGDVKDINNFFRAICSTLKPRPMECKSIAKFNDKVTQEERHSFNWDDPETKEAYEAQILAEKKEFERE